MSRTTHAVPVVKSEPGTAGPFADDAMAAPPHHQPARVVVLADLNVDPPMSDGDEPLPVPGAPSPFNSRLNNDESSQEKSTLISKDVDGVEGDCRKLNKLGKCRSKISKVECSLDCGGDGDVDQPCQGTPSSREEKVSSLKTGLVHVARKMPKNAHAHFILGLMYQRLGQPQKAVSAYEKAAEILLRPEIEIERPELLSLVQIHHAQCILLESLGDDNSDKELEHDELEEIISKLRESMRADTRHATVWNTLGLILLKTNRVQSAISVLSYLLAVAPNNYDCLGNLGIAYLQSGKMEQSAKCFQELILKDQNHPAALMNYAALLLCKYGAVVPGAGANAGVGALVDQLTAVNLAKECLLTALKSDPKASHIWINLADAYYTIGDHRNSSKCLEKSVKLDPGCMATRYAVALHRMKDVERSQDRSDQLLWAGNEMASIVRDGDSAIIQVPVAWSGLAMVHKVQHEIVAAFGNESNELMDVEESATYSLKQAVAEEPDEAVHWHQLGLHSLCTRQFKASQKYLKAAVARMRECSCAWSNLGISLHLSEEPSQAEVVYKRALALTGAEHVHTIFSNLGNLYRHLRQYGRARAMFAKSLELRPGYAPAFNNLGLVFVAEGKWEEAQYCFSQALQADPLLDAAKSNTIKAAAMSRLCASLSSCIIQDRNMPQ
ncbi:probable UDP-N-acetylglucosamine--peptide N-acetylglucosaminyltransferase SEC [Syzygium oleosum]|uniref:probable UDP-N-acetylglucosamine--peptide N-acetylglucosaminyltransferase SEC n=1 Tax=Syzygium oleosum TaxID=219896 RepID=UPI0024BA5776|nr:probable UDP-N-acetylglucosamine--peptide N-acetylglucosaminyltransferase SEC [Syzygium oleosum]